MLYNNDEYQKENLKKLVDFCWSYFYFDCNTFIFSRGWKQWKNLLIFSFRKWWTTYYMLKIKNNDTENTLKRTKFMYIHVKSENGIHN